MPIVYTADPIYPNLLISTTYDPFDPENDTNYGLAQMNKFLAENPDNLYVVSDLTKANLNFTDIMLGVEYGGHPEDSPLRNERVMVATVAQGEIYRLMTEWFRQKLYGAIHIPIFDTFEAGREYLIAKMHERDHINDK